MNGTLSAGDILALSKDGDGMFGNVGWIILLFIFLLAINGNGFGNNGVSAAALTQSELQAGLYNQTVDANLRDIRNNQNATQAEIANSNYNALSNAKDLSAQLASCCCSNEKAILTQTNMLTQQMTANTQAILDKLCSQEIQNLRDEVAGYRETLSNANQTQNILSSIGKFYINNPIGYYTNYCPYNYGTTIQ